MQIIFSRHAKRRAELYKIPEQTIFKILEGKELNEGTHEIVQNIEEFKYPLKVVVAITNNLITVITNYPLKRGVKK